LAWALKLSWRKCLIKALLAEMFDIKALLAEMFDLLVACQLPSENIISFMWSISA